MSDIIYSPSVSSPGTNGTHNSSSVNYDSHSQPTNSRIIDSRINNFNSGYDLKDYNDNLMFGLSELAYNRNTNSARSLNNKLDRYYRQNINYNQKLFNDAKKYDEYMSSTAIQRQVADLKASGLNPVLATRLGGASYRGVSAPYNYSIPNLQNYYYEVPNLDLNNYLSSSYNLYDSLLNYDAKLLGFNNAKELSEMSFLHSQSLQEQQQSYNLTNHYLNFEYEKDMASIEQDYKLTNDYNKYIYDSAARSEQFFYDMNKSAYSNELSKDFIKWQIKNDPEYISNYKRNMSQTTLNNSKSVNTTIDNFYKALPIYNILYK